MTDSRSKDEKYLIKKLRQLVKFSQVSVANIKSDTHEETEWHDYAGDFVRRSFIRQQTADMELKWDASIIPRQNASANIYVFTGGLGWQTEPETRGFLLSVQGEEKIEFDVTKKLAHWVSKDGTVEMIYLPTWESGVDSGGFFFISLITIPDNNQGVVEFSVRSLGNGSRRWFALDSKEPSLNQIRKLAQALD